MPAKPIYSRKNKPPTKRTQPKSKKIEDVKCIARRALKMVEVGECKSLREAAGMLSIGTNINFEAIRSSINRIKKAIQEEEEWHGLLTLSKEEEDILLGVVLAFDTASLPLSGEQIRQCVAKSFGKEVSPAWVTRFKQRNKQYLSSTEVKNIETRRVKAVSPQEVQEWLERLEAFLETHHFPADARLNVDETRLVPPKVSKRVTSKQRQKKNSRGSRTKSLGTLVPFVCADGSTFISYYVVKDKTESKFRGVIPKDQRGRGTWQRKYAVSRTSFLTKDLFKSMMNDFEKEWTNANPGKHCIIFLDNCSIHRSNEIRPGDLDKNLVLNLAKKGIWLYFLPPNTTSWLQPLDDVAFGKFKVVLGRAHADICFRFALHYNRDASLNLQDAVNAETEAFTKAAVRRSWINTGLATEGFPCRIDKEKIMRRARDNFGASQRGCSTPTEKAKKVALQFITNTQKPSIENRQTSPAKKNTFQNADELWVGAQKLQEKETLEAETREKIAQEALKEKEEKRQTKIDTRKQKELAALEKKAQKAQQATQKQIDENIQLSKKCRRCNMIFKGGKTWTHCKSCGQFNLCPVCSGDKRMMKQHESKCKKK